MTRLTCCLITLAAAAVVQTAQATCTYPPEVTVPDGKTATDAEMKAANAAVKDYMAAVEAYLACLDEEEKSLGEAVTDEQKNVHTARHNAAVDALNAVAARYNEQVQVFKKRSSQ
jgi:hypothetical protein